MVLPRGRKKVSVRVRQALSADGLFELIRAGAERLHDHRRPGAAISLADALMSAFAMFALKDPSLLAFDRRRGDENMKKLFHIERIPSDTQKQDGSTKNDCERNATRRLLEKIRRQHFRLKLIVVEDGLSSNAPHVRDLLEYGMHFIVGVKPGDHAFLFEQVEARRREGRAPTLTWKEGHHTCEVSWAYSVPLNESNQDLKVDFLEYNEYDQDGTRVKHFTWITDLPITLRNARLFIRGGRARWRIENETINTLVLRALLSAQTNTSSPRTANCQLHARECSDNSA